MVFGGFFPFGSLEVGTLAKYIGPTEVLLINACISAVVAGLVLRMLWRGERSRGRLRDNSGTEA